jgi:IS5 family transposase
MRPERTVQATLFAVFAGHQIGCELKAISDWLDGQRALLSLVASDLRREGRRPTGRRGLPAETVLRCALLKQQRQLSYEELAFDLEDSASFCALARLPLAWSPKKSVLHQTISAVRPETWEAVNRALVASAQQEKLETGALVRIASTVTEALMHAPSDSTLLGDAVRVMSRLLRQAAKLPGALVIRWRDPSAPGQALCDRHPIQPWQRPSAPALSQTDRRHACHPGSAAGSRPPGEWLGRHGGHAVVRSSGSLSAADRAPSRPK